MAETSQKRIDQFMKLRKRAPGRKGQTRKAKSDNKTKQLTKATADSTSTNKHLENDMKELHKFDLDPSFGPSLDSTRMERWNRAEGLGLSPPESIKNLIEDHADQVQYTHTIWQKHNLLSIPTA